MNLDINEILARPAEELSKLSDDELTTLLSPFFPAARQPVLPELRASGPKTTVSMQHFNTKVDNIASVLAQLKAMK